MGRTKHKLKQAPFVSTPWEILNSPAYIALAHSSGKALPYFLGKFGIEYGMAYTRSGGTSLTGKPIIFSYSEAASFGFANRTFSRIIEDLIEKGFIEMAGYGGLRGFCKTNNKFILSTRWQQYGRPGFQTIPRYPSEMP